MHCSESKSEDRYREWEEVAECPVCAATERDVVFAPDIARCGGCGTCYRSSRPTQAEIGRFYEGGVTYDWWKPEEAVRRRLWRRRAELVRRHQPGGRLLDVSTGDGHFLEVAREFGWRAEGTEFSRRAAALCRERGFEVVIGAPGEIKAEAGGYDVVSLWHVLEHLPRPMEALRRAREWLRPGGVLVVAVPNETRALLGARLARRHPFGALHWGHEVHLTHFVPRTLRVALERAGFEPAEFGVDDVEVKPTRRTERRRRRQELLNRLTGWHWSAAMYAIARKPVRRDVV